MTRVVHPEYLCPNCQTMLVKDPHLTMFLANLREDSDISTVETRTLPQALRKAQFCPSCGGTIDLRALVDGKLDRHGNGVRIGLAFAMTMFALLLINPVEWSIWINTLVSAVSGAVAWFAADMIERTRIAQFRKTPD
jgi:hypothetical protein